MLSKEAPSTIFWVFGMTLPGIEPRSPGPLANTLTAWPMSGIKCKYALIVKKFLFQPIQFNQTIQFSISMPFYLTHRCGPIRCYHAGSEWNLEAMAIRRYFAFLKAPALQELHHQNVYCLIQDTCCGVLPFCKGAVGVFYSPSRLGNPIREHFFNIIYLCVVGYNMNSINLQ